MKLDRVILVRPAYDKRPKNKGDPNYGIHGAELLFGLKSKRGAVQFVIYTNWYLPKVAEEMRGKDRFLTGKSMFEPLPADLGYHSPKPTYKGQESITESCEWLNGKPCYYDGSGLQAEKVFNILITEGHEAMWKYLEEYYYSIFPNKPKKKKKSDIA